MAKRNYHENLGKCTICHKSKEEHCTKFPEELTLFAGKKICESHDRLSLSRKVNVALVTTDIVKTMKNIISYDSLLLQTVT